MPSLTITDETVSLSMETHLERIALEGELVANVINTFRTAVPTFIQSLMDSKQQFMKSFQDNRNIVTDLTKKEKNAIDAARHLDFLNYGDRLISVPESFEGNLLDYAKSLRQVADIVYKVQNTVITDYKTILSSFITNKEDKLSLKDHTDFFKRIQLQREQLQKELKQFAASKTGESKAKLNTVMRRFAELEPLVKEVSLLTNAHEMTKLNHIADSVNECVDLLTIITDGMQRSTINNVSSNAALNISQGAYEVAKYVEFVSIVYFDVTVLLNCVDKLVNTLIATK